VIKLPSEAIEWSPFWLPVVAVVFALAASELRATLRNPWNLCLALGLIALPAGQVLLATALRPGAAGQIAPSWANISNLCAFTLWPVLAAALLIRTRKLVLHSAVFVLLNGLSWLWASFACWVSLNKVGVL
jgi:hypothetical protein